jgi:cbb3-type cytochrome oxidase maturation protein
VSILYILIPLGLVLVAIGVWAFFWAVGAGQFDDLDTPGWSVLVDEHSGRDPPTEGEKEGEAR